MDAYMPLGIASAKEVALYVGAMTAAICWSFTFILKYVSERSQLYHIYKSQKVLIDGAKMPYFKELIDGTLDMFVFTILLMVVLIGYHYFYHYQGSKSIYLMKRLPDKWELHKRCLTIPVLAILTTLIVMGIFCLAYYGIYLYCTPQQCLQV